MELDRLATTLRNLSGWRHLFHSAPPGYNRDEEQRNVEGLQQEMAVIAPKVSEKAVEIAKLKSERKSLYQRFTRVSANEHMLTMLYTLSACHKILAYLSCRVILLSF